MRSPEAFFDTLFFTHALQAFSGGITRLQIQRLGFLACLMAAFRKKPMADWGYVYSSTQYGTPYSASLWEAWDGLHGSNFLRSTHFSDEPAGEADDLSEIPDATVIRTQLTSAGEHFFKGLESLQTLARRVPYLRTAADSSLAVSASTFHTALTNEPTSRSGRSHPDGAILLKGPASALLYRQLSAVNEALKPAPDDLFTPAVTWLRYSAEEDISTGGARHNEW